MKKKLLTFLMAIFMIVPLAGCGEQNLDREPNNRQAKLLITFAEQVSATEYKTSPSELANSYGDCAVVEGSGFYENGEQATISISYNKDACTFLGWAKQNGEHVQAFTNPTMATKTLNIGDSDMGKTIKVYAVMGPKSGGATLNVATTTFETKGFTTIAYSYDTLFELNATSITINDPDDGNIIYTYDSANKTFTKSGGGETATINEKEDSVILNGRTYVVVRNQERKVSGLTPLGSSSSVENRKKITGTELNKYSFVGNGESGLGVSFDSFINTNLKGTKDQGITLASLASNSNLSYFSFDSASNGNSELQYYKVTWKYAIGKCDNPNVYPNKVFDPREEIFNYSEVCLSAEIDFTEGITNSFISDAIKSTMYSQAFISNNSSSACLTATKANENITSDCMFVRNMGMLTDVERNPDADDSKLGPFPYYYALNTDSFGAERVEGILPSGNSVVYRTMLAGAQSGKELKYETKTINYLKNNLKIKLMPIYEKLEKALTNPSSLISDLEYEYNKTIDSIVIKSLKMGADTYHFNYVSNASEGAVYQPKNNKYALNKNYEYSDMYELEFDKDSTGIISADTSAANDLKALINQNPQNLLVGSETKEKNVKDLVYKLIHSDLKSGNLKNLKKYEYSVEIDTENKKIKVDVVNRQFNINDIKALSFGYAVSPSETNNIYHVKYNHATTPTQISGIDCMNNDDFTRLMCKINSIMDASSIKNQEGIKITSGKDSDHKDYVEYTFYGSSALTSISYRVRYYANEKQFVVLHATEDSIKQFTYTFTSPKNDVTFTGVKSIAYATYLLDNKPTYTISQDKIDAITTYKVTIGGVNYLLDMVANKVYNLNQGKMEGDLFRQYQSEIKYYFIVNTSTYGVFEAAGATGYELYKLNGDGEKDGEICDLTSVTYVEFGNNKYYQLSGTKPNYKITTSSGELDLVSAGTDQFKVEFLDYVVGIYDKEDEKFVSYIDDANDAVRKAMANVLKLLQDTSNYSKVKELEIASTSRYVFVDETTGKVWEITKQPTENTYVLVYDRNEYVVTFIAPAS